MLDQKNLDIKTYYYLFLRNRALFFVPFVVVFCLVSLSSLFFHKVYESSTVIRVQREQPNPIGTEKLVREDLQSRLKTVKEMILSRTALTRAIQEMHIDRDVTNNMEMKVLLDSIRANITIESKGAGLFSIAFQDQDPQRAKEFTKTLADHFINENLTLKRGEAFSSVDFIQKQLGIYKLKLEESEEALRQFKLAHIDEMPGAENTNLVQLDRLRDALAKTNLDLQEAQGKRRFIGKQLSSENPMVVSMISGEAASTEEKIHVLEFQLSQLLANYTEKHPDIIRIRSELDKLRAQAAQPGNDDGEMLPQSGEFSTLNPLHQKLKGDLSNIEISIGTLNNKQKILRGQILEFEEKVRSIPNQEKELVALQRDYNVNEKIYQMLLMKLEEARISKQLEVNQGGTRFQVIDPADFPVLPVKPDRLNFLLAGLAFGCAAGVGAIYMKEYFDTSTRGVREAEEVYKVPVLATVPVIATEKEIRQKKKQQWKWIFSSFFFFLCLFGAVVYAMFHIE